MFLLPRLSAFLLLLERDEKKNMAEFTGRCGTYRGGHAIKFARVGLCLPATRTVLQLSLLSVSISVPFEKCHYYATVCSTTG